MIVLYICSVSVALFCVCVADCVKCWLVFALVGLELSELGVSVVCMAGAAGGGEAVVLFACPYAGAVSMICCDNCG